jgi:cyclase
MRVISRATALLLAIAITSCVNRRPVLESPPLLLSSGSADSGFTVRAIAKGVYAVVRSEPLGLINESNALFIVGDTDVIVVDAQSSSARTREVLGALRRITNKPVSTLINTHWHDDHVVGNEVYRSAFPAMAIVAHATAPEDMATTGVAFRKGVDSRAGTIGFLRGLVARKESFLGGPIGPEESRSHELSAWLMEEYSNASAAFRPLSASRTVDDVLELRQGARRIRVQFLGRGHTRGDLVVFLPDEGILAAGDLLMWPVPFVGSTSYPADFAVTEERLRGLAPRWVVPGHGKVLTASEADAHAERIVRMLRSVSTQAAAAAARGETLDQARKSIDLSEARRELVGGNRLREILFDYYVAGSAVARAYELAAKPSGGVQR